jgi:hypothetical protein
VGYADWYETTAPAMKGALLAAGDNVDALNYLLQIGYCARIIDDIYDQDKKLTDVDVLDAFDLLVSRIPCNAFYQEHIKALQPFQTLAWCGWQQANRLCKGSKTQRIYAHVYRDLIHEMYPAVALMTRGYDAMIETRSFLESCFSDSWEKSLHR